MIGLEPANINVFNKIKWEIVVDGYGVEQKGDFQSCGKVLKQSGSKKYMGVRMKIITTVRSQMIGKMRWVWGTTWRHRWELSVLCYPRNMVIYHYPPVEVILTVILHIFIIKNYSHLFSNYYPKYTI